MFSSYPKSHPSNHENLASLAKKYENLTKPQEKWLRQNPTVYKNYMIFLS